MITVASAFQVQAGADQTAVEGDTVGLLGASFTFFGNLSELGGSVKWGDGTIEPVSLVAGTDGGTFANTHQYVDNDTYTVTLTLTDSTGTTVEDSLLVLVTNAAPAIPTQDSRQTDEGADFPLLLNFTDAGTADTHTATINWGDGSPVESGTILQSAGGVQVSAAYPRLVNLWDLLRFIVRLFRRVNDDEIGEHTAGLLL